MAKLGLKMDLTPVARVEIDRLLGSWIEIASIKGLVAIGYSTTLVVDHGDHSNELVLTIQNRVGPEYAAEHPNKKLVDHELICKAYYEPTSDGILAEGVFQVKYFKPNHSQPFTPILNPIWTHYVVAELADDYSWIVLTSKFCKCSWILARHTLDDQVYQEIYNRLETKKFLVHKLRKFE